MTTQLLTPQLPFVEKETIMRYSPKSQVSFMVEQMKRGAIARRPDLRQYTDKRLVDWLFEELHELREAKESESKNRLFNTLCELDDCHNLLRELIARQVAHPCDTSMVFELLNVISTSGHLSNLYLQIRRVKGKLRSFDRCATK